jgi:glycosyltransferase involved in cell wall biosynthesis
MTARPLHVGFVVEQALGHVAYGMSLRRALERHADIDCIWIEVPFESAGIGALPLIRNNWTLRGSLRARTLIRREHFARRLDALFIHTQTISIFADGIMNAVPTLLSLDATPVNVDSLATHYAHKVSPGPVEALKRRMHRRIYARAAAFTTWSQWAKDSLVRDYGVDADDVTVVHPGTTIADYDARPAPPGAHDGPLRVLFVGGDFERKGGDLLLSVFERELRGRCELHLVTAADIPPGGGVHVYNGVKPHSPELLRLYRESDVFVLPTRGDCLAVVLGEAMAASLPVITTRVGAHAEAVEDGRSGFVTDVDDAEALAARLRQLAGDRDLVARLGARSREIAEDRFDIARGADTIASIIKRIASGARVPAPVAVEAAR